MTNDQRRRWSCGKMYPVWAFRETMSKTLYQEMIDGSLQTGCRSITYTSRHDPQPDESASSLKCGSVGRWSLVDGRL